MAVHDDGRRTVFGPGEQREKGSHGRVALQKQGEVSIIVHEGNVKEIGWNSHGHFVKVNE